MKILVGYLKKQIGERISNPAEMFKHLKAQ
jgi:hypothetical protein